MNRPGGVFYGAISFALVSMFFLTASAGEFLPPGFRPLPLGVHALVGGKVVIKPGETLDGADHRHSRRLIEAVGKDVAVPADARVWDMKGLTIYAGFIEPYLALGTHQPAGLHLATANRSTRRRLRPAA